MDFTRNNRKRLALMSSVSNKQPRLRRIFSLSTFSLETTFSPLNSRPERSIGVYKNALQKKNVILIELSARDTQ